MRGRPRKFSDDTIRAMVAAYVAGDKVENICALFGCAKGTLSRYVKRAGVRPRHEHNKRQQIISISLGNPRLGPTSIAREVGAHLNYVKRVRQQCGLRLGVAAPNESGLSSVGR